jgi:stearoyl-CoA desaturase (delta-9 desaturase)
MKNLNLINPRLPLSKNQKPIKPGITLFMIVLHIFAFTALLPQFWSVQGVITLLALYWITVIGITIGLHRLVSHRSFQTPKWLERILVLMGALSCEHGPIRWVGLHRHHHKFSDQLNDHHDVVRGFWWSHMEWMFHDVPAMKEVGRFTEDLQSDSFYRWLDRWFLLLQLPLVIFLYWYGKTNSIHGGGLGLVLWGIPLRIVLVYHVTWLVASANHIFGYTNFDSPDLAKNCWWIAILSFGEGWHNNHHTFPHSARHGLRWFEFDFTWQHIKVLKFLGLAKKIRLAPIK